MRCSEAIKEMKEWNSAFDCRKMSNCSQIHNFLNGVRTVDALRAVPSEEVTLELTNGLSPIVLTPVDKKQDFAYMVLPVRIKNG